MTTFRHILSATLTALTLFLSISAGAQINQTLLGVHLGSTTQEEIQSLYPEGVFQELNTGREDAEKLYCLTLVRTTFAGITWDTISFYMKEGLVHSAHLSKESYSSNYLITLWSDLTTALKKKYGQFEKESLNPRLHYFSDNRVSIILTAESYKCKLDYLDNNSLYDYYVRIGALKGETIHADDL